MKIIKEILTPKELKEMAAAGFGDMIKAVVDTERELVAVDAELHADLEALLLENGSKQKDLWGINLYPDLAGEDFLEYDSIGEGTGTVLAYGLHDNELQETCPRCCLERRAKTINKTGDGSDATDLEYSGCGEPSLV